MNSTAIEKAIRDCGLPGRLVELDKNLVTVDLLNDRTERLERVELGLSEFCDMLLDQRQKLIARADNGNRSATPGRGRPAPAASTVEAELSVENAA
jgi:hypothetical protein